MAVYAYISKDRSTVIPDGWRGPIEERQSCTQLRERCLTSAATRSAWCYSSRLRSVQRPTTLRWCITLSWSRVFNRLQQGENSKRNLRWRDRRSGWYRRRAQRHTVAFSNATRTPLLVHLVVVAWLSTTDHTQGSETIVTWERWKRVWWYLHIGIAHSLLSSQE